MKCVNCGNAEHAHINGRCPRNLSVDLTADSIERANTTGHPRLLKLLLKGTPLKYNGEPLFSGVSITRLTISGG